MDLMPAKKKGDDEGKQINIRLSAEDYARLEKFAALLPVTAIARAAMLIGLEAIEKRPSILAEGTKPRR